MSAADFAARNAGYKTMTARRNAERLEDLRWMIETGEHLSGAAIRLGITEASLEKWCERNGHFTEAGILRDRNPINPNSYADAREIGKNGRAAQRMAGAA